MKKLLLLTVAIFVAVSCSSVDNKHFKAVQFFNQNKDKLAELCYSEFPSVPKYIKGDEVIVIEEKEVAIPYQVDCDSVVNANKMNKKSNVVNGYVYTKNIKELKHRIDTLQKSNTALEAKLRAEINKLNASNVLMSEKIEDSLKQLKTANKENNKLEWIIKGLAAALVILTFLKLK